MTASAARPSSSICKLTKALEQFNCVLGRDRGGVKLPQLDQERVRQCGKEASRQGFSCFDLAFDRAFGQAGVRAVLLLEEFENLAGSLQDRPRHSRQPGDVNAVTLVGAAGHNLVEKR